MKTDKALDKSFGDWDIREVRARSEVLPRSGGLVIQCPNCRIKSKMGTVENNR